MRWMGQMHLGATIGSAALALLALAPAAALHAQESAPTQVELAGGKLVYSTPASWKREEPRSRIIQYEFSAPADAKSPDDAARITIMGAGGSIEANIDRWYGQFESVDGKKVQDTAKKEKFEAAGQTVHWVDVSGTFRDTMGGGPFSGGQTVLRKDYRMLGAIIATPDSGLYFIKLTGKQAVVDKLADDFKKSLREIKAK